jgi:hypothetical protein
MHLGELECLFLYLDLAKHKKHYSLLFFRSQTTVLLQNIHKTEDLPNVSYINPNSQGIWWACLTQCPPCAGAGWACPQRGGGRCPPPTCRVSPPWRGPIHSKSTPAITFGPGLLALQISLQSIYTLTTSNSTKIPLRIKKIQNIG